MEGNRGCYEKKNKSWSRRVSCPQDETKPSFRSLRIQGGGTSILSMEARCRAIYWSFLGAEDWEGGDMVLRDKLARAEL